MRLALAALAALLVAGCTVQVIVIPLPVPVAVTPVPSASSEIQPGAVGAGLLVGQPYVEIGPDGATFYEAYRWNGVVGGSAPGQLFPVTGVDSWGEWWQIEFADKLVWVYADEVVPYNTDDVPIVWP